MLKLPKCQKGFIIIKLIIEIIQKYIWLFKREI